MPTTSRLANTPKRPSQTRKKLAPAFVLTVGVALQLAGCGGNVDDGSKPGPSVAGSGGSTAKGGTGGGGGTNSSACPISQPYGGDCAGDLVCSYSLGSCGPSTSRCVDGKWSSTMITCNPPAPPCPTGEIVEGASCSNGGFSFTSCPQVVAGCETVFQCRGTWQKTQDTCATCPPQIPSPDTPCAKEGLACDYPIAGCPAQTTCKGSVWTTSSPPCNPPPPPLVCPDEPPLAGAACDTGGSEAECSYQVDATCTEGFSCVLGVWSRATQPCDQPANPACGTIADAKACEAVKACRWLWPGCASPPQVKLGQAGCFPAADCKTDTDCLAAGATCQTVVSDPCHGKPCDACGQESRVCQ